MDSKECSNLPSYSSQDLGAPIMNILLFIGSEESRVKQSQNVCVDTFKKILSIEMRQLTKHMYHFLTFWEPKYLHISIEIVLNAERPK